MGTKSQFYHDVSCLSVVACDRDGQYYHSNYVGCGSCGARLKTCHFFACQTCTDGKINCEVSLELCGECIFTRSPGHVIIQYVNSKAYGMVEPHVVGNPPKQKSAQ